MLEAEQQDDVLKRLYFAPRTRAQGRWRVRMLSMFASSFAGMIGSSCSLSIIGCLKTGDQE